MLLQMHRQRRWRQFSERACSTKLLDERSGEGRRPTLIATYERPPPPPLNSHARDDSRRTESRSLAIGSLMYSNGPEEVSFCFSIPAAAPPPSPPSKWQLFDHHLVLESSILYGCVQYALLLPFIPPLTKISMV